MSIKMTSVFKDNLAQLPDAPAVAKIVFKKESKKRKAKDEGGGESDSVQEDAGVLFDTCLLLLQLVICPFLCAKKNSPSSFLVFSLTP